MKRTALVICLAAIMLLALAVPAFAQPNGTSGTVYGKAVLAPYAITISGPGADSNNPLTYQGTLGNWAMERYGSQVTVTNVGTQSTRVRVDVGTLPTDGTSTWNLSVGSGPDNAAWYLDGWPQNTTCYVLPTNDPSYGGATEFYNPLQPGESNVLNSGFQFPTSTSSMGDHYMSATLSAVAP